MTPCDKYACSATQIKSSNTDTSRTYTSCKDLKNATEPRKVIQLSSGMIVMCDTETDGGGWTIFQRRLSGNVTFNGNWSQFKQGFGDYDLGEFYLGNENIHCLTVNRAIEMRADVKWEGKNFTFIFRDFRLSAEYDDYTVSYSSTTPANSYLNNSKFATIDHYVYQLNSDDCNARYKSGWWYHVGCTVFNLNGPWGGMTPYGIFSISVNWGPPYTSFNFTEMKIREV